MLLLFLVWCSVSVSFFGIVAFHLMGCRTKSRIILEYNCLSSCMLVLFGSLPRFDFNSFVICWVLSSDAPFSFDIRIDNLRFTNTNTQTHTQFVLRFRFICLSEVSANVALTLETDATEKHLSSLFKFVALLMPHYGAKVRQRRR